MSEDMDSFEDLTFSQLELCSYRYLQQVAKSMGVPCNVKKVYLIEMIRAKKYSNSSALEAIIERIKQERQQQALKKPRRKKKRVQGTEITSTSTSHSPPITMRPKRRYMISYPYPTKDPRMNILRPTISKRAIESDRVLRSFNMRMRPNYSILNVNSSVLGVIREQGALHRSEEEREYPLSMFQRQQLFVRTYPRQKVTVVEDTETLDDGGRQLVPVIRNINTPSSRPAKRNRQLSGIYPLNPPETYYRCPPNVNIRRQDGSLSKINALVYRSNEKRKENRSKGLLPLNDVIPESNMQVTVDFEANSSTESVNSNMERQISETVAEDYEPEVCDQHTQTGPYKPIKHTENAHKSVSYMKNQRLEFFSENCNYEPEILIHTERANTWNEEEKSAPNINYTERDPKDTQHHNIENGPRDCIRDSEKMNPKDCNKYTGNDLRDSENNPKDCYSHAENDLRDCNQNLNAKEHQQYSAQNKPVYWTEACPVNKEQGRSGNKEPNSTNRTENLPKEPYYPENQNTLPRNYERFAQNGTESNNGNTYSGIQNYSKRYTEIRDTQNIYTGNDDPQNRYIENDDSRNKYPENFNSQSRFIDCHAPQSRLTEILDPRSRNTGNNDSGIGHAENLNTPNIYAQIQTSRNRYAENLDTQSRFAENQDPQNRYAENFTPQSRLAENLAPQSRLAENLAPQSRLAENYAPQSRFPEIPNPQNRYAENLDTRNRYAENLDPLRRFTENHNPEIRPTENHANVQARNEDYPNMSALTDVYPDNHTYTELSSNARGNFSVYYHKKIRAEQVRNTIQEPRTEERLPRIAEVFSQFNNVQYKHLTQPLYVEVNQETDKSHRTLERRAVVLECIYNLKRLTHAGKQQSDTDTHCVYSTTTVSTPLPQQSTAFGLQYEYGPPNKYPYNMESETMPRLYDYVKMAEQERQNIMCDEVLSSTDSLGSYTSQELGANVTIPDMVEDAMELISQDGDYMERIGMDVKISCIACSTWAGPNNMLEYHIRKEHTAIITRVQSEWRATFPLSCIWSMPSHRICLLDDELYVLSASCVRHHSLALALCTLPTVSEDIPKYCRLGIYQKGTNNPFLWEGEITQLTDEIPYNEHGLKIDINSLKILPNNVMLVNEKLVYECNGKEIVEEDLRGIDITVYVKIFD